MAGPFFTRPPWGTEPAVRFTAHGRPAPAGSKRAVPIRTGSGETVGMRAIDDSRNTKGWKQVVAAAAAERAPAQLLDGPIAVQITFGRARPVSAMGSGRNSGVVKAKSPAYPAVRPDVLKLARAVEDALTGVLWRDDAQIVDEHISKVYAPREQCQVAVWQLPATHKALAEAERMREVIGGLEVPGAVEIAERLDGMAAKLLDPESLGLLWHDPTPSAELRAIADELREAA